MANYFPKPYPDELLYSVIARFAVHVGLTSPKRLLDEVFADRGVIAVIDLPSHMQAMKLSLGEYWDAKPQDTIYAFTLFPLYAPFVPEDRRQIVMSKMLGDNGGTIHTALGVAASSVKVPSMLRYCPACLNDYYKSFGEYFWRRLFQITGVDYCPVHFCRLDIARLAFHNSHRHEFIAATPKNCLPTDKDTNIIEPRINFARIDTLIEMIESVLGLPAQVSPTYRQWSHFYYNLACSVGACNRRRIDHRALQQAVSAAWTDDWLFTHGCSLNQQANSSWLCDIFRKHRKSHSYLRHFIIWSTFSPARTVQEILNEVKSFPGSERVPKCENSLPATDVQTSSYRTKWIELLQTANASEIGIGPARAQAGGKAVYAWLYRHDREWLLATNKLHAYRRQKNCRRVNWSQRDWCAARRIIEIEKQMGDDLTLPRKTKNWYLNRVAKTYCRIETISKLPITRALLSRYEETLLEYQIRRCAASVARLIYDHKPIERWRIERMAGLRRDRESAELQYFLQWIEETCSEQSAFQANSRFVEIDFPGKLFSKH